LQLGNLKARLGLFSAVFRIEVKTKIRTCAVHEGYAFSTKNTHLNLDLSRPIIDAHSVKNLAEI
jgi:hypothetical protein